MTTHNNTSVTSNAAAEQRMDRYARRVVTALDAQAAELPHDIAERLRAARVRAVGERKRGAVSVAAGLKASETLVSVGGSAAALQGGPSSGDWLDRLFDLPVLKQLAPFLPLLALVVGFWMAGTVSREERIAEIAQVDAAILQDDLPPAAYADPGFAQFLRDQR